MPIDQTTPSRGMKTRDAAKYLGVSVNTLQKLIRLGHVPAPVKFSGLDRNFHDRFALDAVISARAAAP
jgi:excisionase family DNA binding protein